MLPVPKLDFRRTPVTLIIAAVAVAIELVCTFDPARRDVYAMGWRLGMLSPVWSGEVWRPFTTTLLHGSLIHAAFNVYWLVTFGRILEPYFGSARYLLFVVLLGCCSTMPSFLINNWATELDGQSSSVGLSGIIYGFFGFLWVGQRFRRDFASVCGPDVIQLFIAWFFFCMVLTYLGILPIDNVAHGVGCAVGLLWGQAFHAQSRQLLWRAAALAVALLCVGSMFAAPGHPLYEKHMHNEAAKARNRQIRQADELPSAPPAEIPPVSHVQP